MNINYVKGDATYPVGDGVKIIAHVCNNVGGWGTGFVLAISKRWKEPKEVYRKSRNMIAKDNGKFHLGQIQLVQVEDDIYVANMIAQHGYRGALNKVPLRYEALDICLLQVARRAKWIGASVHMPRIGCGLAGGKWDMVEVLIGETLGFLDIPTCVYDL